MTITPQRAHRDLTTAHTLLNQLTRRLPPAIHQAHQTIRNPHNDKPKTETTSPRKGWINDPTGELATTITLNEQRHLELLEAHLTTLLLALTHLTQFADQWTPILGERTRCHGGRTIDNWSNPNCTNWADTYLRADGTEQVRGDGLCTACRKRRDRWERQQGAA